VKHGHRHAIITWRPSAPADRCDTANLSLFLIAFTLLRRVAPNTHILSSAAALQARQRRPVLALLMFDVMCGLLERGDQGDDRRDFARAQRVTEILAEQLGSVEGGSSTGGV